MCAFNKLNGVYACENRLLLSTSLSATGFDGFVLTDFGAAHSLCCRSTTAWTWRRAPRSTTRRETILAAVRRGGHGVHASTSTCSGSCARCSGSACSTTIPRRRRSRSRSTARSRARSPSRDHAAQEPRRRAAAGGRRLDSIAVIGGDANRSHARAARRMSRRPTGVAARRPPRPRARGVDVEYAPGTDPVGPTSMLPGPAAVPSSVFTAAGRRARPAGQVLRQTDLSGAPFVTRTERGVPLRAGLPRRSPASPACTAPSCSRRRATRARPLHRDADRARVRRLLASR